MKHRRPSGPPRGAGPAVRIRMYVLRRIRMYVLRTYIHLPRAGLDTQISAYGADLKDFSHGHCSRWPPPPKVGLCAIAFLRLKPPRGVAICRGGHDCTRGEASTSMHPVLLMASWRECAVHAKVQGGVFFCFWGKGADLSALSSFLLPLRLLLRRLLSWSATISRVAGL